MPEPKLESADLTVGSVGEKESEPAKEKRAGLDKAEDESTTIPAPLMQNQDTFSSSRDPVKSDEVTAPTKQERDVSGPR